jgi:hypothetical protein
MILEVCSPDGQPPLLARRSIAAANDAGRWVFEELGETYPFEQKNRYRATRKANRFTPNMLHDYQRALGVPQRQPDWRGAELIINH